MEQLVSLSLASFSVGGQSFEWLYTISEVCTGEERRCGRTFIVKTECSYVC